MASPHIPTATYRLQFNRQFGFIEAREVVPYLQALGITDIYASPLLKARKDSPHGYDVTDPGQLNPELGSREDFTSLADTLKQHGMGLLLDVVPNHMAASVDNPWWRDVLRHGRASTYATYFDIDWQPARPGLVNKVLLPVLGEPFGKVLENQQLALKLAEDGFRVCYYEKEFPLSPFSSRRILGGWAQTLAEDGGAAEQALSQLRDLLASLSALPLPRAGELSTPWQQAWKSLWHLYNTNPPVKAFIDRNLRKLNGKKGDPQSFNQLEGILAEQAYRLAYWRVANEEINYRRFFDVSDLVAIRMEDKRVFEAVHALIFQLVGAGQVTGLRIDHIDGLYDPQEYLNRLQEHLSAAGSSPGFYVVAEKILSDGEELPATWRTHGTTGYDFLNSLNGLFVDEEGLAALEEFYARYSGAETDFTRVVYNQKKLVMTRLFASEVRNLVGELGRLAEEDRLGHDLTLAELEEALVAVTASLGIYRTYIRDFTVVQQDRHHIETAIAEAVRRCPAAGPACRFLRQVLLLDFPVSLPPEQRQAWLRFVMRWQQFTGPVMAKGYEDTSLYIYNPLVSLNEVGSSPRTRCISVAEFHRRNKTRQERWPHTLNATSTHDTKRSEDVRARINVLTEIPNAWVERVERWRRWNGPKKLNIKGEPVPDGNMELFIYQTLIGAWPLLEEEIPAFKERLRAYMVKAAREAKTRTSWLDPDTAYEKALVEFVLSILTPEPGNRFLPDFLSFQKVVAFYGAWNSLAQILLKITSPGVPDFYQGTELWNLSLVDPDNRRPVDFKTRARLLQRLKEEETKGQLALVRNLLTSWQDGRVKLYLTYKSLHFRCDHRELFATGEYIPVAVTGSSSGHACAFARHLGREWALVVVPRLPARLLTGKVIPANGGLPAPGFLPGETLWQGTNLVLPEQAPGNWHNILTGEVLASIPSPEGKVLTLADTWRNFPVALLTEDQ
ncbi:malto-oligosyltrehalose synthase [Neomoorella thermoacetica]|uniref:malto-oligosyltrehalose synthase n=1 Tax=Neomoorella thermoacetica TaxID=1525 RepID=UPI0008FB3D45|nr:malto-oligosyltrehalose synthase [Moorella thermoacetica]APC09018.1 maltooligosyl trehalose synthase [Moorella thermoacetica]